MQHISLGPCTTVRCLLIVTIMNSDNTFTHIHWGCFSDTEVIVRFPQCQWGGVLVGIEPWQIAIDRNPVVCAFRGICCTYYQNLSVSSTGVILNCILQKTFSSRGFNNLRVHISLCLCILLYVLKYVCMKDDNKFDFDLIWFDLIRVARFIWAPGRLGTG